MNYLFQNDIDYSGRSKARVGVNPPESYSEFPNQIPMFRNQTDPHLVSLNPGSVSIHRNPIVPGQGRPGVTVHGRS